ncbi:MAG: hypothetical protein Q9167_000464 [Letrouitia subvulpina]
MKFEGTCINIKALLLSTAVLNIATDILILVLPMPIVWHMSIPKAQKIAVSFIFLMGGFVCVGSVFRACYLHDVVNPDPLWTTVDAGIWTLVEPSIGISTASLPVMGPLLRGLMPVKNFVRSLRTITITTSGPSRGGNTKFWTAPEKPTSSLDGLTDLTQFESLTDWSIHKPSFSSEVWVSPTVVASPLGPDFLQEPPKVVTFESSRGDEEKGYPINHICFDGCRHSM